MFPCLKIANKPTSKRGKNPQTNKQTPNKLGLPKLRNCDEMVLFPGQLPLNVFPQIPESAFVFVLTSLVKKSLKSVVSSAGTV